MTSDPLVAAIAQLIARHHTGTNQPVQPAPWMTAAAAELAAAFATQRHKYGTYRNNLGLCAIEDVEHEITRKAFS